MSDAPVVHIGENSPEYIALKLLRDIVHSERNLAGGQLSRERILDLYSECLLAVLEPSNRLQGMNKLPPLGK